MEKKGEEEDKDGRSEREKGINADERTDGETSAVQKFLPFLQNWNGVSYFHFFLVKYVFFLGHVWRPFPFSILRLLPRTAVSHKSCEALFPVFSECTQAFSGNPIWPKPPLFPSFSHKMGVGIVKSLLEQALLWCENSGMKTRHWHS